MCRRCAMKRGLWIVAMLAAVACRGEGIVGPEPGPMKPADGRRSFAPYVVDGDGVPVYPPGTEGDWVAAGTWLKIDLGSGFEARGEYSIDVLLTSTIYGNSSSGWSHSSDEGLSFNSDLAFGRVSHASL